MIPFDHDKKKILDTYLYDVTEGMYSFHISINPIIYTIADTRFRRELKLRMAICWNKLKKKSSVKRYAFHADFIELSWRTGDRRVIFGLTESDSKWGLIPSFLRNQIRYSPLIRNPL